MTTGAAPTRARTIGAGSSGTGSSGTGSSGADTASGARLVLWPLVALGAAVAAAWGAGWLAVTALVPRAVTVSGGGLEGALTALAGGLLALVAVLAAGLTAGLLAWTVVMAVGVGRCFPRGRRAAPFWTALAVALVGTAGVLVVGLGLLDAPVEAIAATLVLVLAGAGAVYPWWSASRP